ncbi:hypothetical protein [Hymenobacter wooponensis]|uniref:Uncharacterized protein n=1 Tax=Hymenobacter wooponensis TaxID=1525360 RepID=A0A4Z0MB55_9BACT|nr:hypothetical protein [Hymenobacter wooponensis]TGD76993.1 hypothetical protein EU557_24770 [Hymenobacter wooponensis]
MLTNLNSCLLPFIGLSAGAVSMVTVVAARPRGHQPALPALLPYWHHLPGTSRSAYSITFNSILSLQTVRINIVSS